MSLTGIQAYASAKAGQIGLTRQTAHELGRFGITVNCIAPGFVLSNPTTVSQWESYGEEGQRALVERIATRRLGTPEDIANGVLFFAAEEVVVGDRPGPVDRRRARDLLSTATRRPPPGPGSRVVAQPRPRVR